MTINSLLKKCGTGFDLIAVADSTSGHTCEYSSVAEAQEECKGIKIISWEVGVYVECLKIKIALFITI